MTCIGQFIMSVDLGRQMEFVTTREIYMTRNGLKCGIVSLRRISDLMDFPRISYICGHRNNKARKGGCVEPLMQNEDKSAF